METKRRAWSQQTKVIVTLLLLALTIYLLVKFSAVLPPIIIAVILAFVLNPMVNRLYGWLHIRRGLAILIVYLFLTCLITLIFMVGIPLLGDQIRDLNLNLNHELDQLRNLFTQPISLAGFSINGADLATQLEKSLSGFMETTLNRTIVLLADVLSALVWLVFITVISIYLIRDQQKITQWVDGLVPPYLLEDFSLLRNEIYTVWSSFFRSQIILALIVTCIITLEGLAIGLPFALVMGLLAGLLEFMPSVGHGIWLVLASLLGLLLGSTWLPLPHWVFLIVIVIIHTIFTQFDLNYLIPRIIGRSVHLPPLVVILGIIAGATLAGVLGVVLAAPTIASLRVLGRYIYAQLFNLNPFPDSIASPLPPPNPRWWRKPSSDQSIPNPSS